MTDKVIEIEVLRKIKGLKKSIKIMSNLIKIKQNYLNNLSLFVSYSSINKECHSLKAEIMEISSTVESYKKILERLRKEV
jgi:hypothetical protein